MVIVNAECKKNGNHYDLYVLGTKVFSSRHQGQMECLAADIRCAFNRHATIVAGEQREREAATVDAKRTGDPADATGTEYTD